MQRTFLLLCFCMMCILGNAIAQVPNYLPTNGLVAWYPFSGNANDESGNGHHGTPQGVLLTNDRFLVGQHAYLFPSAGAAIDCGADSVFMLNDFTLSAWIRLSTNLEPLQTIISKGDTDVTASYALRVAFDKLQGDFYFSNFNLRLQCFLPIIQPSRWTHVVATHSTIYGSSLYIDGSLCTTTTVASANTSQLSINEPLRIGAQGPMLRTPVKSGKLDDIALWNRALGTEEIETMYQQSLVGRASAIAEGTISVSPSPATDQVMLDCSPDLIGTRFQIVNSQGQVVQEDVVASERMRIDLVHLPSGIFTLRLIDVEHTIKFVVE